MSGSFVLLQNARFTIFEQILMRNQVSRAETVVTYVESKRKTIEKRTVKSRVLIRKFAYGTQVCYAVNK